VFTASSFGKASATSGLSTTIFDDSRSRLIYLPRTKDPEKSERLYSTRNSSFLVFLAFFINFSFSFAREASADNANRITLLGVSDYQQSAPFRNTKSDGLVKSRNSIKFVIPAKAGIQLFQDVLDPGFRRGDASRDFLRDHQK